MKTFSLTQFDLTAMLRCGSDLRNVARAGESLEETAGAVVRYLYEGARDEAGERECVLARFYKTHPYGALEPGLQRFARKALGDRTPSSDMKCLTLLATAGVEPDWNDRHRSAGHQAIPLPSVGMVERAPMIAELIRAMGLDIESVVSPRPELLRGLEGKTYNVFYVPDASGSPFIPTQDGFVRRHGIRSVVGFGGVLLGGDLYAVILFTRVAISQESADRFRNIALDLKIAISGIPGENTFAPSEAGAVLA